MLPRTLTQVTTHPWAWAYLPRTAHCHRWAILLTELWPVFYSTHRSVPSDRVITAHVSAQLLATSLLLFDFCLALEGASPQFIAAPILLTSKWSPQHYAFKAITFRQCKFQTSWTFHFPVRRSTIFAATSTRQRMQNMTYPVGLTIRLSARVLNSSPVPICSASRHYCRFYAFYLSALGSCSWQARRPSFSAS